MIALLSGQHAGSVGFISGSSAGLLSLRSSSLKVITDWAILDRVHTKCRDTIEGKINGINYTNFTGKRK